MKKMSHNKLLFSNEIRIFQTDDEEYDNEWVVKIVGGPQEAKNIAQTVGYRYIAPVCFAVYRARYLLSKNSNSLTTTCHLFT